MSEQMRHLQLILAVLLLAAVVWGEEAVKVPEGVRYKEASAEVNDRAKELLRKRFSAKASDEDVIGMFESLVVCGPGLWSDLKKDESLAALKEGRVEFQVPVLDDKGKVVSTSKLEGKLFQNKDEMLLFWKAFVKRTEFAELKVRKLNEEELKIFWAMISFDITEPLFILENSKHKILVVFTAPDQLKIAWIDDYRRLVRKEDKAPKE